jgi:YD repeat-containing protein
MSPDQSTWDGGRHQYVAELLYAQIRRDHPDLAADPNAYLIGFTDASMYSVDYRWRAVFSQHDARRTAVISTNGLLNRWPMNSTTQSNSADQKFRARLRRILLKNVAVLYWQLPLNFDPTSLLHNPLDPDLPTEDIYESDLAPERTRWGRYEEEPCIFFTYSVKQGVKPLPGSSIHDCSDIREIPHDDSVEVFETDLHLGVLIDRHTDFNLEDSIPIRFQRTTRNGWKGPNSFGISGTDNYDDYLMSADNITVFVVHADGSRNELVRQPRWLPILPLVKYVDADYSGKFYEMRWYLHPFEHYDLKRFDGSVRTFLPCSSAAALCYQVGYRNAQGQVLKFDRDGGRKLRQLTTPNNSWLHLTYSEAGMITQIDDSTGRSVRYGYDDDKQLISVTYPSGEVFHYEYDDAQNLLVFSVAIDAKSAPKVILRNEYTNGRLTRQTLADGTVYAYSYNPVTEDSITEAKVSTSDGTIFNLDMNEYYSTVHEQDAEPAGPKNATTPQ